MEKKPTISEKETGDIVKFLGEVSIFKELPKDIILDDMYTPLGIVLQGYRAVFDDDAVAYDKVASSAQQETRRKNRTLFGNYQLFGRIPQVFCPWRSPVALQMFSHKLLRVIAP